MYKDIPKEDGKSFQKDGSENHVGKQTNRNMFQKDGGSKGNRNESYDQNTDHDRQQFQGVGNGSPPHRFDNQQTWPNRRPFRPDTLPVEELRGKKNFHPAGRRGNNQGNFHPDGNFGQEHYIQPGRNKPGQQDFQPDNRKGSGQQYFHPTGGRGNFKNDSRARGNGQNNHSPGSRRRNEQDIPFYGNSFGIRGNGHHDKGQNNSPMPGDKDGMPDLVKECLLQTLMREGREGRY